MFFRAPFSFFTLEIKGIVTVKYTPETLLETMIQQLHEDYAEALVDPASFVIEDTLSGTSENAVQNKVIKAALDKKADENIYATDVTLTAYTSSFTVLHNKNENPIPTYPDQTIEAASDSLLGAIESGIALHMGDYPLTVVPSYDPDDGTTLLGYALTYNAEPMSGMNLQWKKIDDTKPIFVINLIKGTRRMGIYSSAESVGDGNMLYIGYDLAEVVTDLAVAAANIDDEPASGSDHPVKSGGVYAAIQAAAPAEKTGTFTPNFTPVSGSYLTIKQVGHVVYLSGILQIKTIPFGYDDLGTISGVDAPLQATDIPIVSHVDDYETYDQINPGWISIVVDQGGIKIAQKITPADHVVKINGFYFTA